ncbi:MAG: toprim domain-containing protein [Patescibacteria group bacterium]|nr:toprim domain-containing protein [Patescibacteria group bacterium]
MINLPEPIKKFTAKFSRLPGIGPRQATRLAFYLINKEKNEAGEIGGAVLGLEKIKICENCFFVHQNKGNLCDICEDKNRNQKSIAIVEKETDLLSLENTAKFNGRYLVLGQINRSGILEDWQKKRLENFKESIKNNFGGKADEIILALSPSRYGDFSASILLKELKPYAVKISRLGRGLPVGSEIEFADEETLGEALKNRS